EAGSAQVAIYLTRADASGAVFELDDLKSDPHAVVSDLTSPESVLLGRDRRLYFTEIYVNAADGSRVHRIQRLESDNTKTLIALWPIDELRPSGLLFSPNGDLWIGTTSVTGGAPTKGVWRIAHATGSAPFTSEQIFTGDQFLQVPEGNLASVKPAAFLPNQSLLIVDDPHATGELTSGRVLVTTWPDYKSVNSLISASGGTDFRPAGLAVNSKGDIFVTDFEGGAVLQYDWQGTLKGEFAKVTHAHQISIANDDKVYVTTGAFSR